MNQRRGFKSSKKDTKTTEAAKERSEMKLKMNELSKKVEDNGCRTVGEYFYSLYTKNEIIENWHNSDEPVEKIRGQFVYRKLYEIEFDAIWEMQKQFYIDVLTNKNYIKIKDNTIFYQRPLKSQKHLISKCRFEPNKRVAPKSSFDFQEFRIWQTINNLRVTNTARFREFLTLDEKIILAEALGKAKELSQSKIKDILTLGRKAQFNDMPEKIKGNTTYFKLSEALGKDFFEKQSLEFKYKLWHTLFFANDEEWLLEYAQTKLGLSEKQAENYVEVDLEPDYSSISTKAIKGLVAYMKEGHDYPIACEYLAYHHSFDEETDSKERELKEKIEREKGDEIRNPLVQQAVSETVRLVNAILKEYGKPDRIRVEFARSLKKPKNLRENTKRNNDEKERKRNAYAEFLNKNADKTGLTKISKSDIIKFELWLEMQFAENDLKKIGKDINIEEFRKFANNVRSSDKEKYQLWLECGRISPYSGEIINLSSLFSSEIEIEHIIPYSKCMNDSFGNKTLCERKVNEMKLNRTPFEFFQSDPDEWRAFKERVRNFPDGKQEKFTLEEIPSGFLNSQLTNTAYIAKEARKKLKTICKDVRITNGQATSHLRRFWGLNDLLNSEGKNEKTRNDHRHHAIDALVIANTTESYINQLSQQSQFDYIGKMLLKDVKHPYPAFKLDAAEKIHSMLISFRNKKRLITTKKNKYTHTKSKTKTEQLSYEVRGPLHEETYYGQIINPNTQHLTGEKKYVTRKNINSLETLKQIDKIVDEGIKKIIKDHIEANGGEKSLKKSLSLPITMYSKDGKKQIPIKKVRIFDNSESLIQLRPNLNPKLFVASGDNYLIAIYENSESGERDYETLPFFDAAKRAKNKQSLVSKTKGDKNLLQILSKKDMVIVYNDHLEEIDWQDKNGLFKRLFRVIKFNTNGQIALGIHNLTKINPDKPKEYPEGVVINCRASNIKAIKVKISTTGKIIRI